MDHLPHPKNSRFPPSSIPYLAARFPDLEYEVGDFYSFPKRHSSDGLFQQHATTQTFLRDLCLFQSYCFIGLYVEFFGVFDIHIDIKDLVHLVHTANMPIETVITTRVLPMHLQRLEAKTRAWDDDYEDEVADQLIEIDRLMTTVGDFISELESKRIRELERKFSRRIALEGYCSTEPTSPLLCLAKLSGPAQVLSRCIHVIGIPDLGLKKGCWRQGGVEARYTVS